MSEEDSFINEVNDELRRDRLFALLRRYGWIAVLAILLLVGGAAWNEVRKSRVEARAQAFGDSLLEAMSIEDADERAAALSALESEGSGMALLGFIGAAESGEGNDPTALREVAAQPQVPAVYRDLALLKAAMAETDTRSPEDRIADLEPLTNPGAPFRLLALEQTALAEIERGGSDRALQILEEIAEDGGASEGLRRRASQLIVALGGDEDGA